MSEVTISEYEYNALRIAEMVLDALEAGGVDNWDYYDESLSGLRSDPIYLNLHERQKELRAKKS